MLAERPAAQNVSSKAFLPASATEKLEPLGLTPAKKVGACRFSCTGPVGQRAMHDTASMCRCTQRMRSPSQPASRRSTGSG